MKLIGVDIGGSHISASRVDFEGKEALVSGFEEADVDAFGTVDEILEAWSAVIERVGVTAETTRIGIAMPGPYDYPKGISLIKDQGKMGSLYGLSVKNLLSVRLGIAPQQIEFTNDAEAFLAGESHAGAGRAFQNSIGITLGTGLGSAIKVQNNIQDAKLWTAPFRSGIAEDYLGTAWFVRYAKDKFDKDISGVRELVQSEFDEDQAKLIFEEFGNTLGEFLHPYLLRYQIEGVVMGGKVSLAASRFLGFTHNYLISNGYDVPIEVSQLGEKSALIGAVLPFLEKI